MGDHSRREAVDPPTDDFTPVSPAPSPAVEQKLVVATTLAALLYGVLEVIQANSAVLDPLPPWARSLIVTLIPPLMGLAAGYRVPSNRV